ncbi:hypothetical protein Tco_1029924 [Tanacetum coccineum]|uniref:Uncharacterized protein n=1 Tax=Tanacetum coccineum TaxID=301880 RepID=A0ABQ5G606_9ASTR
MARSRQEKLGDKENVSLLNSKWRSGTECYLKSISMVGEWYDLVRKEKLSTTICRTFVNHFERVGPGGLSAEVNPDRDCENLRFVVKNALRLVGGNEIMKEAKAKKDPCLSFVELLEQGAEYTWEPRVQFG